MACRPLAQRLYKAQGSAANVRFQARLKLSGLIYVGWQNYGEMAWCLVYVLETISKTIVALV